MTRPILKRHRADTPPVANYAEGMQYIIGLVLLQFESRTVLESLRLTFDVLYACFASLSDIYLLTINRRDHYRRAMATLQEACVVPCCKTLEDTMPERRRVINIPSHTMR
jgi:hypothetical protein